jgi:hypothetical protein
VNGWNKRENTRKNRPRLPAFDCATPFNVDENAPAVNFTTVGSVERLLDAALLLVLDERIATRLALNKE